MRSQELHAEELECIPLVFAGWLRYLMAVDDQGEAFALSPDPLLEELRPYVEGIRLGEPVDVQARLQPVLEKKEIFGVNLYQCGLAQKVCRYFEKMTKGPGAVRRTLEEAVGA